MNKIPENNEKEKVEELGLFDLLSIALKDLLELLQDIRFAAVLLILIAVATLIGTALPQISMAGDSAVRELTAVFGENVYMKIIRPLGFDDVFKTTWYRFVILLLVASVTLCAWGRTKTAIALGKVKNIVSRDKSIRGFRFSGEADFESNEEALQWVNKEISGRGFNLKKEESGEETHFLGRKNLASKWMLVLMHYSFVVILLGAIIGSLGGYKDTAVIMEDEVWQTKNKKSTIRLVDYWMEFNSKQFPTEMSYFKGGLPSDFKSKVELLDDNQNPIGEYIIEVNYPLKHNGYNYYQTAWHYEPIFAIYKDGELFDRFSVDRDKPFPLGDTRKAFFVPFKQVVSGKKIVGKSGEDIPPMCILYEVDMSSEDEHGDVPLIPVEQAGNGTGIFKQGEVVQYDINDHEYELKFEGMREYTILEVKRDPGVGFVFLGLFLCVLGGTWGLLIPFGTARAIVRPKSGKWQVIWGQTLPPHDSINK